VNRVGWDRTEVADGRQVFGSSSICRSLSDHHPEVPVWSREGRIDGWAFRGEGHGDDGLGRIARSRLLTAVATVTATATATSTAATAPTAATATLPLITL
jgi:hypothetical protein